MATINQSPAGQASVTLSSIDLGDIAATVTPFWQSRKIVGSDSVAATIGGGEALPPQPPLIPTSGQIWPLAIT